MTKKLSCFTNYTLQYLGVQKYDGTPLLSWGGSTGISHLVVYVVNGSVTFTSQKNKSEKYSFKAGDIIYIPESFAYISQWSGETINSYSMRFKFSKMLVSRNIWIDISTVPYEKNQEFSNVPTKIMTVTEEVKLLFQELHTNYHSDIESDNIMAVSNFYRLWNILMQKLSRKIGSGELKKVIDYIEAHITEPFDSDKLCEISYLSKSTLFKKFKAETGKTPVQYRNELLAKLGHELLKYENTSIESVSEMLNLCSPDYFTVIYKKYYGKTPRAAKNSKKK